MAIYISTATHYGLTIVEIDNRDYAIGTDYQVSSAFEQYVDENLWKIESNLIEQYSILSIKAIDAIKEALEETANNDLYNSLVSFDALINSLIRHYQGYGLLSEYNEIQMNMGDFYYKYPDLLTSQDIKQIKEELGNVKFLDDIFMFRL